MIFFLIDNSDWGALGKAIQVFYRMLHGFETGVEPAQHMCVLHCFKLHGQNVSLVDTVLKYCLSLKLTAVTV